MYYNINCWYIPETVNRRQTNPLKHKPSSSTSDSKTNGGDSEVTIRKTDRAFDDSPETKISPPEIKNSWHNELFTNKILKNSSDLAK